MIKHVVIAPTYQRIKDWCREKDISERQVVAITGKSNIQKLRGIRINVADKNSPNVIVLGWPNDSLLAHEIRCALRVCGWNQ